VVTNPRIFDPSSTAAQAFRFLDALIDGPGCSLIRPGPNHRGFFDAFAKMENCMGRFVADAAHAAQAIESGCERVSADTDFARFAPLLRWQHL
jgi:hypothetical protein